MMGRMMPGAGLSLASTLMGAAIVAASSPTQGHPWKTRAAWNPLAKRWVAAMQTGFVNERAPYYRATIGEQKELDPDFGLNPLTGEPYFEAHVFDRKTTETGTQALLLPMYVSPAMPLQLYPVGFDGDSTRPVPDFFKKLGVQEAPTLPTAEEVAAGATLPDMNRPKGLRLLRACDFLLHQPRQALTSTVTLEAGPATGLSNVTQVLGLRPAIPGDVLRVFQGVAGSRTPQPINPLEGDYTEPTFDEILVSTVYLLSPEGATVGSDPDLTWTPFVRHNLFWNLNYEQPGFHPLPDDPGRVTIPPIGSGAATLLINYLTASINDAAQQALNILTAHTMAGSFWTATGGGSDATPIIDAVASTANAGLNKAALNKARAVAAAQARLRDRLDPAFPYRAERFDLRLLGLAA